MAWRAVAVVLLIGARVVALSVTLSHVPADPSGHYVASDALRYTEIAQTPGTPYRDFDVEIPPVELVALELIASPDPRGTAVRNAWLQFTLDLLTMLALAWGWGWGVASIYLLIGLPLAPFLYFRLDLLSVCLATWGVALARRGRPGGAGAVLGAGVLTKLWPLILFPLMLDRRRRSALLWGAVTLVVGLLAWVAWAGPDGPFQVATLRRATGWQIESAPGSLLLAGTDLPVVFEQGANRIGEISTSARVACAVLLIVVLVAISWAAARHHGTGEGLVALGSVAALLAFAPIVSWQYVAWLLPWTAIVVWERRRWTALMAFGVVALTALLVVRGVPLTARDDLAVGLLLARNALLAALPVCAYLALVRMPEAGRERAA
jgi:hypothetical protein